MSPHLLSPFRLVVDDRVNDFLEELPGSANTVLNIALHPPELGLGKGSSDGRRVKHAPIRTQLRRQSIKKPFAPWLWTCIRTSWQTAFATMRYDGQHMLREEARKPSL